MKRWRNSVYRPAEPRDARAEGRQEKRLLQMLRSMGRAATPVPVPRKADAVFDDVL